jgi:signal transduction histidine kinase
MEERAAEIGGLLEIESSAGAGTRVRLELPRNGAAP